MVGPGEYEPTRAEVLTKQRIQQVDLGSSQARPNKLTQDRDIDVAPGQYEHHKNFGDDTKSFKMGEKREKRVEETAGPGAYNPERADGMTR